MVQKFVLIIKVYLYSKKKYDIEKLHKNTTSFSICHNLFTVHEIKNAYKKVTFQEITQKLPKVLKISFRLRSSNRKKGESERDREKYEKRCIIKSH